MSATARVQQWLTFNRLWWLYDAKWQDPYKSAVILAKYLQGMHKPIYEGYKSDCGDHVVVINSSEIALKADDWYYRVYFHHTGYPGGASWTKAHEVHSRDPTKIVEKAVAKELPRYNKHPWLARLHIFPDDNLPDKIAENISDQIRPLRPVPKRLDHYRQEEVESFPKLFDYPKDYIFPDLTWKSKPKKENPKEAGKKQMQQDKKK